MYLRTVDSSSEASCEDSGLLDGSCLASLIARSYPFSRRSTGEYHDRDTKRWTLSAAELSVFGRCAVTVAMALSAGDKLPCPRAALGRLTYILSLACRLAHRGLPADRPLSCLKSITRACSEPSSGQHPHHIHLYLFLHHAHPPSVGILRCLPRALQARGHSGTRSPTPLRD